MATWAEFIINTITRPQRRGYVPFDNGGGKVGGPAQKEMWPNEVPRGVTYSQWNASSNMFSTISQVRLLTETRHRNGGMSQWPGSGGEARFLLLPSKHDCHYMQRGK